MTSIQLLVHPVIFGYFNLMVLHIALLHSCIYSGEHETCTVKYSLPLKTVFTLRSEVVHVGLEVQFEDVVFMDVFRL